MKYLRRVLLRAIVSCLALGSIFTVVAGSAEAQCVAGSQMLAGWDFSSLPGGTGNFGPNDYFPTSPDINSEDRCAFVTGLTRHSALGSGNGAAGAWGGNNFLGTDKDSAIAAGNFFTFTVRAVPGFAISVENIGAYNVRRSSTGPNTGQWQFAVDSGGFTDIGTPIVWGTVTSSSGNPQSLIDLTGISEIQNLSGSTTVTFRLVVWGATGGGGTFYLNKWSAPTSNEQMAVNGTVALAPTAADAIVSGQVVDSFGSGVSGAMVTLVSPRGERRTVRTSSFGYFRFMEVETGETYVISVASKRYRFEPRSVMVGDNIDDLRFTALP
ncbi:MAG: carboxypeptidase-like regulatory domain-containing protein [Pyrinomonadaceae bacterium]|nr:carboxypeptidase-like regulatory domain-containing protein [Pyrinomonadaceae bacterium]